MKERIGLTVKKCDGKSEWAKALQCKHVHKRK